MYVTPGHFEMYFSTDRFDKLALKTQDVLMYRLFAIKQFEVIEVSTVGGWVKVQLDSIDHIAEAQRVLTAYLSPRVAKGEKVIEIFHEWGEVPYTYKYQQGEFKPCL
jgi:hypothetical protein